MNRINRNYTEAGSDEVEEMLRQAEDAALLKLSINGHIAHHSSSDLPPDLADRFLSLKSGPSTSKSSQKSTKAPVVRAEVGEDQASTQIGDDPDDLLARFAALKASLPKPSSSFIVDPVKDESSDLNENHEDEVDKIIRWAVDAARLDPSPESDDDVNENDANASDSDIESSDEDDDDDDDEDYQNKKKKEKGNLHK